MIFAKTTAYGLDDSVKNMQEYLDIELAKYWTGTLNIYSLVFKNTNSNKDIIPETYLGTGINNKEYKQVFNNDKVSAEIGFILQSRELEPQKKANIDLVFTLNLKNLFPTATTRESELALIHAERVVSKYTNIKGFKEGIRDVFSGFFIDNILYNDMHPYQVFSFNIDLTYVDNLNCGTIGVN